MALDALDDVAVQYCYGPDQPPVVELTVSSNPQYFFIVMDSALLEEDPTAYNFWESGQAGLFKQVVVADTSDNPTINIYYLSQETGYPTFQEIPAPPEGYDYDVPYEYDYGAEEETGYEEEGALSEEDVEGTGPPYADEDEEFYEEEVPDAPGAFPEEALEGDCWEDVDGINVT